MPEKTQCPLPVPDVVSDAESGLLRERTWRDTTFFIVLRQFSRNRTALVGLILILTLVLLGLLAPLVAPYHYATIDPINANKGPSAAHWFGTDNLGRDIFSRIMYGGRYSLSLGVLSVCVSLFFGVILGSVSGFFGGWVDNLIMRILDVIQAIPTILIAIIMSSILGSGFLPTIVALAVPSISGFARVLRAQFLKVSQNEFVEAAVSLSVSKVKIMLRHILPNAWAPLIVSATMGVANSVLNASSLSFIGLGIPKNIPEWGAMLSSSRDFMRDFPHMVIIPGLFICITVLALNIVGDGVRDALDPKLKD